MSFTQTVTERTGADVNTVESVLADYGIELQPTAAAPVPLIVERVRFAGVKRREDREDEPFEFDRALSTGLWAITSEVANLAGKSSVLFVIRWALTGRSHLTDDVQSWIDQVEVSGVVGGETFTVRFTNGDDDVSGELTTANAPSVSFEGGSFEEVMDGFFLDRLRLEAMPFWQGRPGGGQDEGDRRVFGWNSYFPAMHLRAENNTMLLGDQAQGGQPGALIQVFLGLPWARTAATARVARNGLRMERSARRRRQADDREARDRLLQPLRDELARLRRALDELVTTRAPISPEDADARLRTFARALTMQREAGGEHARARTAIELAQLDYDGAVKRRDALEQTRLVRPLLGRLAPTVCPRCRVGIGPDRVAREEHDHACSVCAEPLDAQAADEAELDAAREAVAEAEQQLDAARTELAAAEGRAAAAETERVTAEAAVRELEERRPAGNEARDLETRIARLEGRLEDSDLVPAEQDDGMERAYAIVETALAEAEERRSAAADELLVLLGEDIAALGRAFGIANLEAARPSLGAQLRVRIGGVSSSFSARTGGERLRLRLATVIALLRVGQRLGVGRHPGLVLIDSPGGEEMVEGDLAAILGEVKSVCDQLPDLQLICASARAEEVRRIVSEDRIIHGSEYAEVW